MCVCMMIIVIYCSFSETNRANLLYLSTRTHAIRVRACSTKVVPAHTQVGEGSEGEALQPDTMGGIYLPLEKEAKNCIKDPLLLAYRSSHFAALGMYPRTRSRARTHTKRTNKCARHVWVCTDMRVLEYFTHNECISWRDTCTCLQ